MTGSETEGVQRLPHGYTNATCQLAGEMIEKRYLDSGRATVELLCLTGLASVLPVPAVISFDPAVPKLVMRQLHGVHGQELIDSGHAREVLQLAGAALRDLQLVATTTVPELSGDGTVITHGDFGPQNMLFDLDRETVTAILDWEFAHIGAPIEDLAWAEWIVRTHHRTAIDALPALFEGDGRSFAWSARQEGMIRRCEEILNLFESKHDAAGAELWRARTTATAAWVE